MKYLRNSFSVPACEQSVSQEDWDAIFSLKCEIHTEYKAKRKPTAECAQCLAMWNAKQGVKS